MEKKHEQIETICQARNWKLHRNDLETFFGGKRKRKINSFLWSCFWSDKSKRVGFEFNDFLGRKLSMVLRGEPSWLGSFRLNWGGNKLSGFQFRSAQKATKKCEKPSIKTSKTTPHYSAKNRWNQRQEVSNFSLDPQNYKKWNYFPSNKKELYQFQRQICGWARKTRQ